MLRLDGNSERAFASNNSINIAPVVYMEWNYNSISRPYVVTPSDDMVPGATENLDDPESWTEVSGKGKVSLVNRAGIAKYTEIPPPALRMSTGSVTNSTFRSKEFTIDNSTYGNYFKVVFYAKADQQIVSSTPDTILGSEINADASDAGGALFLYRIVQVDRNGRMGSIDYDYQDVVGIYSSTNASNIKLHWDHGKYRGPMYHIYRGQENYLNLKYLTTVPIVRHRVDVINTAGVFSSASARFILEGDVSDTLFAKARFKLTQAKNFGRSSDDLNSQNRRLLDRATRILEDTEWEILSIDSTSISKSIISASYLGTKTIPEIRLDTPRKVQPTITLNTFRDTSITSKQKSLSPIPISNDMIRLIPIPVLKNGENLLESTKYFVRISDTETSMPTSTLNAVDLDAINYKKVEIYFGSRDDFDSVYFDFDINANYVSPSIFIYNPEVYSTDESSFNDIDDWHFKSVEYYPIESVVDSHRPGEALTNPYLTDDDKMINVGVTNIEAIKTKPCSFAVFNPDDLFGNLDPYKQIYDSYLNNTMRYYVTKKLSTSSTKSYIMVKYHESMSINKIVVKGSNCFSDLTTASGRVVLLKSDNTRETISFSEGAFDSSGLMMLHYTGFNSGWKKSRPTDDSYPARLSDSGMLLNVVSDVIGMIFIIDGIKLPAVRGDLKARRAHIIEISPRLELDVSDLVQSFTTTKSMDDSSGVAGFPLSYINSNTANIDISNIPVYKNNFPFTIFDNMSEESTFYGLMRQNVKVIAAIKSPNQDFTDVIPMFCMYVDDWSINDLSTISLSLYDATKANLMAIQAPDYFGEDDSMFTTITNIMDAAGFSDYDYDGLKKIMSRRAKGTTHFWCDRTQSLFEAMQSFFIAHQIGAFFDEYGILRFIDIDEIIEDYLDRDIEADFVVSDIDVDIKSQPASSNTASSIITYIPNLVSDSYQTNVSKRIGKVAIEYSIPMRNFSGNVNVAGLAQVNEAPAAVWTEKENSGIIMSYANRSVLASDNSIFTDPLLSTMRKKSSTPVHTVGTNTGTAFLQGELISWSGLEYRFYPFTKSASITLNASAIVTSASPYASTASIIITSPSATQIKNGMLAYSDAIPLKTTVQRISVKNGTAKTFTASFSGGEKPIIVSKDSSASSVKVDMIITGLKYPDKTYVSAVEITSPSTIITLNNRPKATGALATKAVGASTTLLLSASTTMNGTASTSGSAVNLSTGFNVDFSLNDSEQVANPQFARSLNAIIIDQNDIQDMIRQITSEDARITGMNYDFTGRMFGVTRGNRFTSIRNHYMVDDDLTVAGKEMSGWVRSNVCFNKYIVKDRNTVANLNSSTHKSTIVFDNNVAKMKASRNKTDISYPIVVSPKSQSDSGAYNQPTRASNFNFFSFMFTAPNLAERKNWGDDKEIIEFGLYLNTEGGNLMIGLSNKKKDTYLKTNVDRGTTGSNDNEDDLSNYVLKRIRDEGDADAGDILWSRKVKDVFDGKQHRISFLFHSTHEFTSTAKELYKYCTIIIDDTAYGPYMINKYGTNRNYAIPDKIWGFYVRNTDRNFNSNGVVKTANVNLHEIYACDWWENEGDEIVKKKARWHWQTEKFINGLVNMETDIEPKYYFWGPMMLRGIKFHDSVNFETTPIKVSSLKEDFSGYQPKTTDNQKYKTLTKTDKKNLIISDINKTPFRFSMAITHNKNELVWLSTTDNQVEGTQFAPFSLQANFNKLTDPIVMERVIDASSLANSIQLSTKWVQSRNDAKILLDKMALIANSFNNEINVSIFGNPLIQVGDICQLVYSLKRIGYDPESDRVTPKYFLVKNVTQSYGAGLTTQLTLKPLFDIPE